MASSEMMPNYQRGVMTIVILSLLKREDMYGYQLVQDLEEAAQQSEALAAGKPAGGFC